MSGIKRTPADAKLSDYVRWERDKGVCQRCLKQYTPPAPGLHAAHCFGRRCGKCTTKKPKPHYCTRMDADNILSLCRGCHQFIDSDATGAKERLWRMRIGNTRYDRIAGLAHQKRDRV